MLPPPRPSPSLVLPAPIRLVASSVPSLVSWPSFCKLTYLEVMGVYIICGLGHAGGDTFSDEDAVYDKA
jgi:hypothetical protein